MQTQTGQIAWFDFGTTNADRAMAFFKAVLGWEFSNKGGPYLEITSGQAHVGGIRVEAAATFRPGSGFVPYFNVPSAKEGGSQVTKNGGRLLGEIIPIHEGTSGYIQIFLDLDGNQLALWSAKP